MKYEVSEFSLQGGRPSNQDRVAYAERDNAVLLIVADGLGGHAGGEIAAEIATRWARHAFLSIKQSVITQPSAFLALTLLQVHQQILAETKANYPDIQPRTTCVLCLVQNGYAYWAHVGDSRLYHLRGNNVMMRTLDHSPVEKLHQQGLISEEDMQHHPKKSYLSNCLGGRHKPSISLGEETRLERGDTLLLCTDGVWEAMTPEEMIEQLNKGTLEESLEELLYYAAEDKKKGKGDNATAIGLLWQDEMTSTKPLQNEKATTVSQEFLWEKARLQSGPRPVPGKQSKARVKQVPASKTVKTKTSSKPTSPVETTIDELENYLSQFGQKPSS
ncbi:MAG: hypothetical protein BMS9Abin36_0689 [Gammaproteobacteria bacterium]|nr:MAG: hypothetical protein BMS9Abin36_0689 [Gammaproteobacteria bacterium]